MITHFVDAAGLHHVAVHEDGPKILVATASFSGKVYLFEGDKAGLTPLTSPKETTNWALAFLNDRLYALQTTGAVKAYSIESIRNGEPSVVLDIAPRTPTFAMSLSVVQDGVAVGYANGDLALFRASGKPVFSFRGKGAVRSVALSPHGDVLACGIDAGSVGQVVLYDARYGEVLGSLTSTGEGGAVSAHNGWVFAVGFNADGSALLSAGYDGKVRVWGVSLREREATLGESPGGEDGWGGVLDAKWVNQGVRRMGGGGEGVVAGGLDGGLRWWRGAGV